MTNGNRHFAYLVTDYANAQQAVKQSGASACVSLLDPGTPHHDLDVPHLKLNCLDTSASSNPNSPSLDTVAHLVNFGRDHRSDDLTVVHCWAGVSRSTAATLVLVADRYGVGALPSAVFWLYEHRPEAAPNRLILELGDKLLGTGQSLVRAGRRLRDLTSQLSGLESF